MTDEQIVKALKTLDDALDLIKRQQADKERLEIELQAMRGAANSYKSRVQTLELEIEYLKADKEALINGQLTLQKMYLESRAEAVREFAERLTDIICEKIEKSMSNSNGNDYFITDVYTDIDNLVKEMTEKEGGNNGTEDKYRGIHNT